jgi:hypothetical protein
MRVVGISGNQRPETRDQKPWSWIAALVLFAAAYPIFGQDARGEWTATASITTSQGTRSMPVGIVVTNPLTPQQALPLKKVLEAGGQQALLNAIRGGGRGTLRLGGMEYPLDLVVAQPADDATRYVVVTGRQIKYEETVDEAHAGSLDYPFGILVFDSGGIHTTTGTVFTKGALSISDEGRVQASQYGGEPGTLRDVKRVDDRR